MLKFEEQALGGQIPGTYRYVQVLLFEDEVGFGLAKDWATFLGLHWLEHPDLRLEVRFGEEHLAAQGLVGQTYRKMGYWTIRGKP